MDATSYVLDTFADIDDEFCDNEDYIEGNQILIDSVLDCVTNGRDTAENEDDDSFEWPQESKEYVFVDQLDVYEPEEDCDKAIKCPDCEYATNRQSNFARHINTVHNLVRFHCTQCDKYFADKCSLSRHIKTCHSKILYQCDVCLFTATR